MLFGQDRPGIERVGDLPERTWRVSGRRPRHAPIPELLAGIFQVGNDFVAFVSPLDAKCHVIIGDQPLGV